jgi:hypothetical protein
MPKLSMPADLQENSLVRYMVFRSGGGMTEPQGARYPSFPADSRGRTRYSVSVRVLNFSRVFLSATESEPSREKYLQCIHLGRGQEKEIYERRLGTH